MSCHLRIVCNLTFVAVTLILCAFSYLFFLYWHKQIWPTTNESTTTIAEINDTFRSMNEVSASSLMYPLRICIPESENSLCNNVDRGNEAVCVRVESRIDCAIQLARGTVNIGVFSEEETLVLAHQLPNDLRVVASIRDVNRPDGYAFEAVAVVPAAYYSGNGLDGLRGGKLCHPGLDHADLRWSPRVMKAFEHAAARSNLCPGAETRDKSADELEIETLSSFFDTACRPGPWSANATVDARLKTRFPKLCQLCGNNNNCTGYSIDMSTGVGNVNNNNRHIQALECLRTNGNGSVAYVAWQHVREYFTIRNPAVATNFALLCEDGSTRQLSAELLTGNSAPCAFVRQPWGTVVSDSASASRVLAALRSWYPTGVNPSAGTWQSSMFDRVIGGAASQLSFESGTSTPANHTLTIRNITSIDATSNCLPARRWCTLTAVEQTKCSWIRNAAHILGLQPSISCVPRSTPFQCFEDINKSLLDLYVSSSNYGYLARRHYQLSPVKMVQNAHGTSTRVAAFIKDSARTNITRFENLRGRRACFPEFGGIAFVSFVATAHERGVISASECDYARAVGEFFGSACAPGAADASHALSNDSTYNATGLCSACQSSVPAMGNFSDFTCAWDYTNRFYGVNGSLDCLNDPASDVAFVQTRNLAAHLNQLNIPANNLRALCRNNSLSNVAGINVEDNCLLSVVTAAEVVSRRTDTAALNVLLDSLDLYFGYLAEDGRQLVNLEIFSPFDGINDLLFKDTAIGLTEPVASSTDDHARNYVKLFEHLESCSAATTPSPGIANRNLYSLVMLAFTAFVTRFVIY